MKIESMTNGVAASNTATNSNLCNLNFLSKNYSTYLDNVVVSYLGFCSI